MMKRREFIIKIILLVVIAGVAVAMFISNKPDSAGEKIPGKIGRADYRTYTYGMKTDSTEPYSRLLSLYRDGQKNRYICASLEQCGNSLYLDGYYARAFEAYIMAMQMAEEMADNHGLTVCYYNIGNIFVIFKDYESAAAYYEKVLETPETEQRKSTRSLAAHYLVMCYSRTGKRSKARRAYDKALQMPLSDADINTYYDLLCRGMLLEADGKYAAALSLQLQAYEQTRKHGMKIGMGAYPLAECGRIYASVGNTEEAVRYQRMAMEVARREKAYDQFDDACVALDSLYRKQGESDSAMVYLTMHRRLSENMLNTADFYSARNKLLDYEDSVKRRRIDLLEQKVNLLGAGLVMIVALLAVAAFYGGKLRRAYRMLTVKNQQLIAQQDENRKLTTSAVSSRADDKLLKRILEIMDDRRVVCDSEFSLQTLARMAESNTKYVSAAISATPQGSFKALLNEYRIKEACRRLTDGNYAAYTIQAVAETVGYVSVNNFIVQFKRYTGMTPSLYRKNAIGAK